MMTTLHYDRSYYNPTNNLIYIRSHVGFVDFFTWELKNKKHGSAPQIICCKDLPTQSVPRRSGPRSSFAAHGELLTLERSFSCSWLATLLLSPAIYGFASNARSPEIAPIIWGTLDSTTCS